MSPSYSIPTLETDRLRLRHWDVKDFEAYAALRTNAELQRYVGGPVSKETAWEDFCASSGQWALRGFGIFLVAEKVSDAAAGFAGLWFPPDIDEPELCWSLFPGHAGKGYATEAAAEAKRWANEEQGLPALMSFVHPENLASRKVAERLGASLVEQTTLRGQARLFYRHTLLGLIDKAE